MPKRILEGKVVSDKQERTVTVLVERRYMHPMYKKYVRRTDKYAAHDDTNAFGEGDRVQIQECRPLSKRKCWTVITETKNGSGRPERTTKAEEKENTQQKATKKKSKPAAEKKADAAPIKKPAAKKETSAKKDS